MSTLNFRDCVDNFPLMVMSNFEVCRAFWGDEDEDGNEITEYSNVDLQIAYDELFDFDECFENFDTFNGALSKLNDKLLWYNVELMDGYYDGCQIYVGTEWINLSEWSDEDVEDEFDMNRKVFEKQIKSEREMILNFMEQSKLLGFKELLHLGTFSNGEGIYRYKDEMLKHN